MSQLSLLDRLAQPRRALSVSELTARLKDAIEGQFFDIWVQGEVSNFRRHSSGHWYFSLKDEFAAVRCACFRMQNRLVRFMPADGISVTARGRLSIYEARGEYQLVIEYLEPAGLGGLQLAFEQLKTRLAAEGLFEEGRKRRLPLLPRRVGVVTSPTGAAVRDIIRVIRRRNEAMSVLIAPARVQGEGAAQEIVRAISMLNSRAEVDVIIVGRGGGSIEDLWCFNEETVARAISKSRVPVITAIGHETDFTIADFVADIRASTPSAAAELVTRARDEMYARIGALRESVAALIRYRLLRVRNRLSQLESSRAFSNVTSQMRAACQRTDDAVQAMQSAVRQVVRKRQSNLDALIVRLRECEIRQVMSQRRASLAVLQSRLESAARRDVGHQRQRFALATSKLDSMSPLAVLSRGYAIAFDNNGGVIKRAVDVNPGDAVKVRVADGEMDCTRN